MAMNEHAAIKDPVMMKKSLLVLALVLAGFVFHGVLHFQPATVALFGAGLLLLLSKTHEPHHVLAEIEWPTIFFFLGLFIIVGGVVKVGLIKQMSLAVLDLTQGNLSCHVDGRHVVLGNRIGRGRQHSLCGHDEPVDHRHGTASVAGTVGSTAAAAPRSHAALVVAGPRRMSRRERHRRRSFRQRDCDRDVGKSREKDFISQIHGVRNACNDSDRLAFIGVCMDTVLPFIRQGC